MSDRIAFFAHGNLPRITDQQKGAARVGRGIKFFTKPECKKARRELARLIEPHIPETPLSGALSVRILWVWPWRKSEKKSILKSHDHLPCYTYPDFDNLSKALCDIMETLGFYENDSRIAHGEVFKCWGNNSGLGVEINPIVLVPPTFSNLLNLQGNRPIDDV